MSPSERIPTPPAPVPAPAPAPVPAPAAAPPACIKSAKIASGFVHGYSDVRFKKPG